MLVQSLPAASHKRYTRGLRFTPSLIPNLPPGSTPRDRSLGVVWVPAFTGPDRPMIDKRESSMPFESSALLPNVVGKTMSSAWLSFPLAGILPNTIFSLAGLFKKKKEPPPPVPLKKCFFFLST